MKRYIMLSCIFCLYFIVACEETALKIKSTNVEHKSLPNAQEIKKKVVIKAKNKEALLKKKALSKKKPKLNYKYKKSPVVAIAEIALDVDDQVVEKRVLDLSLPVELTKSTHFSNTPRVNKQQILPDLFVEQSHQKKQTMSVVGKILKRGEKEEGKSKIADGAGISFSLTP